MATPNVYSAVHFVKKYPITLCGFSLLFMPSVYRLLFYFTPLLISTAIFIVAMMSWGPSMASQSRMRRGKRNDWAFSGSLKIYDEDEEEEGEGDDEEVMQEEVADKAVEDSPLEGKPIHVKLDSANKQEPDPDYVEKNERAGMATPQGSASQAEPDPDLHENCVGAGSAYNVCSTGLQEEFMGAASFNNNCCCPAAIQSDPALHADDCVQGRAALSYDLKKRAPNDMHAEQQVAQVEPAHFSTSRLMHAVPTGDLQYLPAPHANCHHAKLAPINPDQPAAAGDNLSYHNAELHDHPSHTEISCLDYDDNAEANDLDYHDAEQLDQRDLPREPAVHAKSKARQVGNDIAVPTEQSELRGIIAGKINRASYKGDPHDRLAHQLVERLQTLQAAA